MQRTGTKQLRVKSVTISRKPGKDREGLWSAFLGLFEENNPHLKGKVPFKVLEYKDVEKVRIRKLENISYYLRGNDIVINDLVELDIKQEGNVLTLAGKQDMEE